MTRDRGLTLIELVAAMAIFALVATMGLQSLSATLRSRDALADRSDAVAALARPLALLRQDLGAAVPLLFYPPGRGSPRGAVWVNGDGTVFELSVAGQTDLGRDGAVRTGRLHRVVWRLDAGDGTLYRRQWHALTPAGTSAASPEVAVMTGVTGLAFRSYWLRAGWQPGVSLLAAAAGPSEFDSDTPTAFVFGDDLPEAVEITLITRDHGRIPLLETWQ
ncbi:MAG: type II secretion system protein GspJ [Pseudomonadota bacterium]